jgi:hypothetical protein
MTITVPPVQLIALEQTAFRLACQLGLSDDLEIAIEVCLRLIIHGEPADGCCDRLARGRYRVVIVVNPWEEMLATLAHELRHVWQYESRHLSPCGNRWRGKWISKKLPYEERPDEIDARAFEAGYAARRGVGG